MAVAACWMICDLDSVAEAVAYSVSMMVLRDADILLDIFVTLSKAYVIRLIAAPIVALWLFTVLIAESIDAIAAEALAAVDTPTANAVIDKPVRPICEIATVIVCPEVCPA